MNLELSTAHAEGEHAVVVAAGDIDIFTAPRLIDHVEPLIEAGHRHFVVDLEAVDFIDSTGLGALVGVLKRARVHGGSVAVACTHERTRRLFRMTVLPRDIPTYDTVDEALGSVGGRQAPTV
jgi:anti-sigma B factor antagonist